MPGGANVILTTQEIRDGWRVDRARYRFTEGFRRLGTCLTAETEVFNKLYVRGRSTKRLDSSAAAWKIRNACTTCTGHPNKGPLKG